MRSNATLKVTRDNKKRQYAGFGAVGFLVLIVAAAGLAAVWFKYIAPFMLDQKFALANQKFEFNEFEQASELYEKLLPRTPESLKQTVQDRIAQLGLAKQYLIEATAEHPGIQLQALEGMTAKIGLMYIRYAMQNNGAQPMPIRRSLFYLKSAIGKCEVALDRPQNTEVNSWTGDLAPGQRIEGAICVKYVLVDPSERLYLVYNNGKTYANAALRTSAIYGQSEKDPFHDGWQGRMIEPIPVETPKKEVHKKPSAPQPPAVASAAPAAPDQESSVAEPPAMVPLTPAPKNPPPPVPSQVQQAVKQPPAIPGPYVDARFKFSLQVPNGWEKLDLSKLPAQHIARFLPYIAIFKGPDWQGRFPVLMIQKSDFPSGAVLKIDSQAVNAMEKKIRQFLQFQGVQIKQLQGRTTLLGNIQAAHIDLVFTYQKESFHMQSYVLEGSSGFILTYMAYSSDFNNYSNPAVQAIRSFRMTS